MTITPEMLAALAGAGLSLFLAYVPGVSDWYARQTSDWKRAIMGLAIVLAAVAALGASCASVYNAVSCDRDGVVILVQCVFVALVSNQSTYSIAVRGRVIKPPAQADPPEKVGTST